MMFILWLFVFLSWCRCPSGSESEAVSTGVETYTFQNFPKDVVALHFPCKESNMFATNCACHLRCTDGRCNNARRVCEKNRELGCKYMLLRGGKNNRIATLKRIPTSAEAVRFNISSYPTSHQSLETDPRWQQYRPQNGTTAVFRQMAEKVGERASNLLNSVFFPTQDTGKFCGKAYAASAGLSSEDRSAARQRFLQQRIALVALSYHAPRTLLNSMQTWRSSGLLDLMAERIIILNDPLPQEVAIAKEFGFKVVQPKDVAGSKMGKPNVWTIGAAFYYALQLITSDYLLFLENDFKMDVLSSPEETMLELLGGAAVLDSGAEIVRLNSRRYQGCGTFKDCAHHGINLDSQSPGDRLRNWFAFYCRDREGTKDSVSDCLSAPLYRCFTSWDSNWTLNAVLVKRLTMLFKKYPLKEGRGEKSLAEIGLSQWQQQDGFESVMIYSVPWQHWRVPICISYQGLFIHEEIETAT